MNDVDTKITHMTQKNGNIFEDLGFGPQEASKLKIKAQLMCKISEWIKSNYSLLFSRGGEAKSSFKVPHKIGSHPWHTYVFR